MCLVLEAIRAPQFARFAVRSEKKMRHIEHVRAEVGKHTQPLVPPGRIANVARCSVAVEKFHEIDLAETSRRENLL